MTYRDDTQQENKHGSNSLATVEITRLENSGVRHSLDFMGPVAAQRLLNNSDLIAECLQEEEPKETSVMLSTEVVDRPTMELNPA